MNKQEIISKLHDLYPTVRLKAGDTFYWSPTEKTVFYVEETDDLESIWALLHETGHAVLEHTRYATDIQLVLMEMEAWEEAKKIGAQMGVEIEEDHVQDCLDSYRDWLHKRSLCPDCSLAGIQTEQKIYSCVFCYKKWSVTAERFCRPYRRRHTSVNSES